MTADDQDAEVGRLMRERRDLRERREVLLSRASKIGKLLSGVGRALYVQPTHGRFPATSLTVDEHAAVKVSDEYNPQNILTGQMPTAEDIRMLLIDLRQVDERLSQVAVHLKPFEG